MFQIRVKTQRSFLAFMSISLLTLGFLVTVLAGCGSQQIAQAASSTHPEKHVQLKLDIVLNQPGMQKDWPAYSPNNLVVPANSLVTITLHDYDLGDTPLPNNTPFATVQGTVGSVAYLNGVAYTSLAPDKIAHTFTIPQLHLNVPLPGDGKESDSITFTFHTGKAGTYMFQCFDPCGTGATGWEGPMATRGYMMGTLTVQ
ncbi:MAG TPA: hypothetical protein VFV38_29020 [Ktedonobacteraceae bacterium]|nr:hypothetical protein [Ktedonobacteraceae bacterium]